MCFLIYLYSDVSGVGVYLASAACNCSGNFDAVCARGNIDALEREIFRYFYIPGAFLNDQRAVFRIREIDRYLRRIKKTDIFIP